MSPVGRILLTSLTLTSFVLGPIAAQLPGIGSSWLGDGNANDIQGVTCPGEIIGDLRADPVIQIVAAEPARIRGVANNIDAQRVRVVLWALTNQWYVQPFADRPFTLICSDGSWQNTTHFWRRMVALLVDETYSPDATRLHHPACDQGVLAWDQFPASRPDIPINFSERNWCVKVAEDPFKPGPNCFVDSPNSIWVDKDGLHLTISQQEGGRWCSSEVILMESLGYGEYTVLLASRVDDLDPVAVFSPFIYERPGREFDIEFSRCLPTIQPPHNAQYVVQPWNRPGNLITFEMPPEERSTHRMVWAADRIEFLSWRGWSAYPPEPEEIIFQWVYTGPDIPPPGSERFRFNLWQCNGRPPERGIREEVVVRSFTYQPLP